MIPPIHSSPVLQTLSLSPTPPPTTKPKQIEQETIQEPNILSSLKQFIQDFTAFFYTLLSNIFAKKQTATQTIEDPTLVRDIKDLIVTEENRNRIRGLIQDISTSSLPKLAWNAWALRKTGQILRKEVHPLAFLLQIFKDPSTKEHFKKVYEDRHSFSSGRNQIWNDFSSNLTKNFEDRTADIKPYIDSFSEMLSLDKEQMHIFEQEENWEGLLLFITQAKC